MEPTYTKEQLIDAQEIYAQNAKSNPDGFKPNDDSREAAINTIEYLLSLVK
jgi:hypothetical protein